MFDTGALPPSVDSLRALSSQPQRMIKNIKWWNKADYLFKKHATIFLAKKINKSKVQKEKKLIKTRILSDEVRGSYFFFWEKLQVGLFYEHHGKIPPIWISEYKKKKKKFGGNNFTFKKSIVSYSLFFVIFGFLDFRYTICQTSTFLRRK